jgi:hypothetical protein
MAFTRLGVALAVVVGLGTATPVLAGPPLLVHPYNIGSAPSLPWQHPQGRADYDRTHLLRDVGNILTASDSALVHMETVRRALHYARADRARVSALLNTLVEHALALARAGTPSALAYLDAAYVIEAMREVDLMNDMAFTKVGSLADLGRKHDSFDLVQKAVALSPNDGEVQLGAALISRDRHRAESARFSLKVREMATRAPQLARNLDHLAH